MTQNHALQVSYLPQILSQHTVEDKKCCRNVSKKETIFMFFSVKLAKQAPSLGWAKSSTHQSGVFTKNIYRLKRLNEIDSQLLAFLL